MSLGSRPCWYIHALCFPSSWVLSVVFMPSLTCWQSRLTLLWSFRLASNHLPRHFIRCFFGDGMTSSCMRRGNLSLTWPFLMTKHLDLLGLNYMRAQDTVSSSNCRIQRAWMWLSVEMVKSSMKPLQTIMQRFLT